MKGRRVAKRRLQVHFSWLYLLPSQWKSHLKSCLWNLLNYEKFCIVIKRKVFQCHNFVHCTILYVLSKIHMKVNHILLGWCFCRFSNPAMFAYKTFIECLMQDYLHCCKTAQRDKWGLAWKKRRKNIDVIWRRLKSLVQISTSEIKSPAIQYSCQVFSQFY